MYYSQAAKALLFVTATCHVWVASSLEPIPVNGADFGEPDWEAILELAFPTWAPPANGCPRLEELGGDFVEGYDVFPMPKKGKFNPCYYTKAFAAGGDFVEGYDVFPTPEDGKFNPCYYTKAFAGLDPKLGGYPTPIDTHYPYEFAAPFMMQPGDGSTHHCAQDPAVSIGSCPKLGKDCGPDCASITDNYGIGHIPPFVPLAAIKNAYNSGKHDVCADWFHFETSGCNIEKSAMDRLVYKYFGEENTIKYQPPILMDGKPSSTYFRLEYGGESPACDQENCRGPHYCSKAVADAGVIWGDFCPYVSTGEHSGLYRHPHLALAALELWIANQCMPSKCPSTWLDSPNGQEYGTNPEKATSITWCEMDNNEDPMAQPAVPYVWPTSGSGIFPGHELLYPAGKTTKQAPGVYVTEYVDAKSVNTRS
eukprot:CAMPEP_0172520002 /NCGR_PEP_ID=MMETSP1066-20121228/291745_1 /TAXON_ID=671091 /ORGANISM="Coscinodiscus wailesii, Strain CCMP2513" /LENGTH=422 /DNA_ID=CAMNT_0013302681 /DNA_START=37 /DNA_END=1306 /DNA_ORIENTATION=-